MSEQMHLEEVEISEELARRLIAAQLPEMAQLGLSRVDPWGTDNAIWRLGMDHVVRFPRIHWAASQPDHEARWLPVLAPHLPVAAPKPVAVGEPALGYPFRWSVHRWLSGEPATASTVGDATEFAVDLARFVLALQRIPARDAPRATNRARHLSEYDTEARRVIAAATDLIDTTAALEIWADALDAPAHDGDPVWVQGDLEGNCLVTDGRLSGVVDWGSVCAGDPAVDIQVIWSPLFTDDSRNVFIDRLGVDDATIRRSRGAAVQQACAALPYYLHTYPEIVERSRHKLAALGVPTHEP